ncbi:hypothetical protein E3P89_02723 [Wallemia ichthyophaga]|uniref:Polyketide synthase-like phosphopantetheine-binding domain-containing protein n=1 Tax=Wallemia ichthyophaga TaxID=245174 RepID=A0A4T0G9A4_WALIC|nr:hypothetical protein E3P95_02685 [Wallemia ichthyophaga]TIA99098.1 hypothetical protein E3P94_02736 [Wallemia ichthyophaga]TIB10774.1 hypothetical protein E3P90_02739 [Wallemia ichthyophaga]TIB21316.1 hypothetical protein E3P89_02723 [Wallemia ichthyophaga]TIB23063.1 hypothetical protein E3P88_02758 [Wallemia ichthyophaga]
MNYFEAARDTKWTVPGLVQHHLENTTDHIFFEDANGQTYNGKDTHQAVYRAAAYIQQQLNHKNDQYVGLYLENEPLSYSSVFKGVVVSGNRALALSNRNSVPALAELIKKTDTRQLVFGNTSLHLTNNAKEVKEELAKDDFTLNLIEMPSIDILFPKTGEFNVYLDPLPPGFEDESNVIVTLHSSGSSGNFPKLRSITNFSLRGWAIPQMPHKDGVVQDLRGKKVFAGAYPVFHAIGFFYHVLCSLTTPFTITIFKVNLPPQFPTPDGILEAAKKTKSNRLGVVPAFLEKWATEKSSIDFLKTMDLVAFGGAPLNTAAGDALAKEGVLLLSGYGSTECGSACSCFEDVASRSPSDWPYVVLSSNHSYRFIEQENGLFELQFLESDLHVPLVRNLPDVKGYATGDLVEKHPKIQNMVKIVGRSDSQIILASGEKTNPEPIERIINENPLVSASVMFGRQRTANGILIQPKDHLDSVESFVDSIWPSVETANEHAPQHSRLQKALIVVVDINRPLPITPKRTIKRKPAVELYDKEIVQAYNNVDNVGADSITFDIDDVPASVSAIVKSVIGNNVEDDVDLVSQGMDSMQATNIRNKLVAALKPIKNVTLGGTVAFQHPKLTLLSNFIEKLLNDDGKQMSEEDIVATKAAEISATIALHSRKLNSKPKQGWVQPVGEGKNVVLTGTTGGLGAQLLQTLMEDANVEHVYAINRTHAHKSLKQRQADSLAEKGITVDDILDSPKLSLIEADLTKPNLGLSTTIYLEISAKVDVIIHNAWRVDFNVALQSFEQDISGVVNLTNLAITSSQGAAVIFTSSIGSLARWPVGRKTFEEPISDPAIAVGMGYGESKFVGERILATASQTTGLPTTVLRIGQLCGDRKSGFWNSSNWVPAIIKSGLALKCLPNGDDLVEWISLDNAAQAIVDFAHNRRSLGKKHDLLNIVHPRPTSWSAVFNVVAEYLNKRGAGITLVSYSDWLERLQAEDTSNMSENPAIKLLPMFESRAKVSADRREFIPLLQTTRSQAASESLRECTELNQEDVVKWMDKWVDESFL